MASWLGCWFNGVLAELLRFDLVFTGSFGLLDCAVVIVFWVDWFVLGWIWLLFKRAVFAFVDWCFG